MTLDVLEVENRWMRLASLSEVLCSVVHRNSFGLLPVKGRICKGIAIDVLNLGHVIVH